MHHIETADIPSAEQIKNLRLNIVTGKPGSVPPAKRHGNCSCLKAASTLHISSPKSPSPDGHRTAEVPAVTYLAAIHTNVTRLSVAANRKDLIAVIFGMDGESGHFVYPRSVGGIASPCV